MRKSGSFRTKSLLATGAAALLIAVPALAEPATAPGLFPTPQSLRLTGADIALGDSVTIVAPKGTDASSLDLVRQVLTQAGVAHVRIAAGMGKDAGVQVVLGTADTPLVVRALARTGASVPDHAEGYALASKADESGALIVLAGKDADGLYHAAQSLRQLVAKDSIASLTIADYPAMPVRGTIEGFYGKPWTMAQREAHIAFLARFKANTYIYSPKDDTYARDHWRDPYPAETLDALSKVVDVANREHVNFVYAISPGPSVCYSDPADLAAIRAKFGALRARGVRSFYVAFDDIEYTKWNCKGDEAKFGAPGEAAAGKAQASLLNAVQADITADNVSSGPHTGRHGALIMVPTEYYNATVSPYKTALGEALDPRVVVQWTGTDVVPSSISVSDAKAATKAFGRKTLLWDNYPVNDYGESTGRLLMAPYDRRQAGLSSELEGVVANPMNQEVASRPAVAGLLAFAWNDSAYDAQRTWRAAARDMAGGDEATTQALLTFFDTQHLAPTFGHQPWQPQAPVLAAKVDAVRDALASGDVAAARAALARLGKAADALVAAPDRIRAGMPGDTGHGFVAEAGPWLDATALWGRSLRLTVDGLNAALEGSDAASRDFAEAKVLASKAAAIQSIPGATRFAGPIRIADGVLDTFVADAPGLVWTAPAR